MPEPFHLAWFLQGSSAQAWGEPWTGLVGTSWMVPELFTDLARVLERAFFDYVLIGQRPSRFAQDSSLERGGFEPLVCP